MARLGTALSTRWTRLIARTCEHGQRAESSVEWWRVGVEVVGWGVEVEIGFESRATVEERDAARNSSCLNRLEYRPSCTSASLWRPQQAALGCRLRLLWH